jgi:hypothetical protein
VSNLVDFYPLAQKNIFGLITILKVRRGESHHVNAFKGTSAFSRGKKSTVKT